MVILVQLPTGRTRVVEGGAGAAAGWLLERVEELEGIPAAAQRLVCGSAELRPGALLEAGSLVSVRLRLLGGGGDGDQPDWMERGKVITAVRKQRGPDSRAPDWHGDAAKYAAKVERDKRDRGELVITLGPFCVPCGKRFAKQTTYDAHLSGSKHLKALQRLGRVEEAQVCQIDVDAKKRKYQELEEARASTNLEVTYVETEEEIAQRRFEREEKLRQRAMMSFPETIAASSVYEEGEKPEEPVVAAAADEPSAAELAAAASGVGGSYTSGMQDGVVRPNKHTSAHGAASHRSQAVVPNDWFFGSKSTAPPSQEPEAPVGPMMPPPEQPQ